MTVSADDTNTNSDNNDDNNNDKINGNTNNNNNSNNDNNNYDNNNNDNKDDGEAPLTSDMSSLYQEWTVDQDRLLYKNRKESLPAQAALLGRGLRGVESRLKKLTDVNSSAYERLFSRTDNKTHTPNTNHHSDTDTDTDTDSDGTPKASKLVPAKEVLRRIQWDYALSESDFTVLYYDRVQDQVLESPMDAPNMSIQGPQERWIDALPEHRVVGFKYKDRIVWDREKRLDRVFGKTGTTGETIDIVIQNYPQWSKRRDAAIAWNRQRQAQVTTNIQNMLGNDRFQLLKDLSSNLQQQQQQPQMTSETHNNEQLRMVQAAAGAPPSRQEVERYIKSALQIFREARQDPLSCPDASLCPKTDLAALDVLSELVVLLPDSHLRPTILSEIASRMNGLERQNNHISSPLSPLNSATVANAGKSGAFRELPELRDEDLEETFVRGQGPGGQKINKTANRVALLHTPTGLRVECQDTRSLQQNRKIARKRLRLKLDEFINGSESRTSIKVSKAVTKKAKAKARSKARQRKKQEASKKPMDSGNDISSDAKN